MLGKACELNGLDPGRRTEIKQDPVNNNGPQYSPSLQSKSVLRIKVNLGSPALLFPYCFFEVPLPPLFHSIPSL